MKKLNNAIYFDHHATTPVDQRVLDKMLPFFSETFGNPHSSEHVFGWEASRIVDGAAEEISKLIGSDPDEVFFTSGATEANNLALLGISSRAVHGNRRRILVGSTEHKCVLAACRAIAERFRFQIEYLPVNNEGFISKAVLEERINEDVLLVSVMAVNNEIGTIQDIESLSQIARTHGALFHCDAAQAPVALNISSIANHVDLLSLSAHKMYGPKGIGAVYISRHIQDQIEPLIYGGGQQNGIRSGTVPVPLCVGMGEAANILMEESTVSLRTELRIRRDSFERRLRQLKWPISTNGPMGDARHPGNANLCFHGFSAHVLIAALQPNVAASTGSACASGIPEPSHVLDAIGLSQAASSSSVRFSIGFSTTDQEIENAVDLIDAALTQQSETEIAPQNEA